MRVERGEEEIAFNWDEANIRHISRHGVKIEEAEQALRNDSYDLEYEVVDGEQRWTSLGHTDNPMDPARRSRPRHYRASR